MTKPTTKYVLCGLLSCFLAYSAFSQSTKEKDIHLRLIFAGDIMGHGGQIKSACIEEDKLYDYTACFEYIKPVLQQADLAIANLELTLPGSPPYAGYPTFRSPDILAKALRYAGFDILMTANNHSNDAKLEGLLHTIDVLDENHFYHTGTFQSQKERDIFYPLVLYKKGFKLVFLNYTYGTNNPHEHPPAIVNKIDEVQIEKDMQTAKSFNPDAIIVVMHWGEEYNEVHSESQEKLAQKIFGWGATLVIGAHPHVVQGVEIVKGKRGGLVAYSLGNFISGQRKKYTDGGIMLEVALTKSYQTKETHIAEYNFIPIWRYIHKDKKGKNTFMTIPISTFEKEDTTLLKVSTYNKKKMDNYAKYIRKQMKVINCPERKIPLPAISVSKR